MDTLDNDMHMWAEDMWNVVVRVCLIKRMNISIPWLLLQKLSRFKLFQKSEQGCGFSDSTELNAKSLYFYEQLLDIDNLIAD